jgi:protein-disulfide isomerase
VATAQEGKFWEMHNILFANRRNLGTTSLKLHSKEAGVKNKRFLDDLVNATYGWQVQGDLKEGIDRGVKDVPTFFVNGTLIPGNPNVEELSKAIEMALKKVSKKVGTVTKSVNKNVEAAPKKVANPTVKVVPQKAAVKNTKPADKLKKQKA